MSLQGPILLVANKAGGALAQALTEAGAFPIVDVSWAGAQTALTEVQPAAIVAFEPGTPADHEAATGLSRQVAAAAPFIPMLVCRRNGGAATLPDALPIADDAPAGQLIARLSSALRLRTLHSTVLGRAKALESERNIIAELPAGDPLDDATVLLVGRGRHHPTLSVAVGERMGVMGALSVDAAARCLNAREVDGIIIGDGLPAGSVNAFLALLAEDSRFRDLPVAVLAASDDAPGLPNFVRADDPLALLGRAIPLVRMRAFETVLKRLLQSIEHKGMIDARTGLFNAAAFGDALPRAIEDCAGRGVALSLARFSFEQAIDRRTSMDAARLVSRLMRDTDFACREDDGSILFVFGDTELRDAHVAARRLASVLKHTMLRIDREQPNVSPSVTLATLKTADTAASLLERVASRPVAAA
jgi:GGDEF domain-containing protein